MLRQSKSCDFFHLVKLKKPACRLAGNFLFLIFEITHKTCLPAGRRSLSIAYLHVFSKTTEFIFRASLNGGCFETHRHIVHIGFVLRTNKTCSLRPLPRRPEGTKIHRENLCADTVRRGPPAGHRHQLNLF